MKIDDEAHVGARTLRVLKGGDAFQHGGGVFMKCDETRGGDRICVRLTDGFLITFEDETEVEHLPEAKVSRR